LPPAASVKVGVPPLLRLADGAVEEIDDDPHHRNGHPEFLFAAPDGDVAVPCTEDDVPGAGRSGGARRVVQRRSLNGRNQPVVPAVEAFSERRPS
jgi:hypothetical protein